MRLSELSGDQFFDVLYAMTPILPALENIDLFGLYVNGAQGKLPKITENSTQADRDAANKAYMHILVQGISEILKLITSKEHRNCAWEVLGIVDGVSAETAKKYNAAQIWLKLMALFDGNGLKDFFNSAAESDTTE